MNLFNCTHFCNNVNEIQLNLLKFSFRFHDCVTSFAYHAFQHLNAIIVYILLHIQ